VDDAPVELITASYNHEEDQFRVVVTGHGQSRTGTSSDVVTARELADRLVAQIAPSAGATPVVVHLLDGSAIAFTNALLTARYGLTPRP
jgi:Fe-S cluster assembly iron-binding protein IscA